MLGSRYRALAVGVGVVVLAAIGLSTSTRAPDVRIALAAPIAITFPLPHPLPHPEPTAEPRMAEPRFAETLDVSRFFRGNLHTHSNWSDGDKHPKTVYEWYRSHGYSFLALTDHDNRVDPDAFRALEKPGFVIIPGEEITMHAEGRPVHVNGLCTEKKIGGGKFPSKRAALTQAVESVKAQGGVALVNHPNFDWALTKEDVRAARGAQLLEIWSGHPYVNTAGDADRPSHEAIWDALLSSGERFAGVAVDDMHHIDPPRWGGPAARPGKGWVEVFAAKGVTLPNRQAICSALAEGRLYSSSGVVLKRIRVTDTSLSVWPVDRRTVVEFIGQDGHLLEKVAVRPEGEATYRLHGDEQYVRARMTLPDGKKAWTQAYRITREARPVQ